MILNLFHSTLSQSPWSIQVITGTTTSVCGNWYPSINVCDTPHRGNWGSCSLSFGSCWIWFLLEDFFILGSVPCFSSQIIYRKAGVDWHSFILTPSQIFHYSQFKHPLTGSNLCIVTFSFTLLPSSAPVFLSVTSTVPSSCLANVQLKIVLHFFSFNNQVSCFSGYKLLLSSASILQFLLCTNGWGEHTSNALHRHSCTPSVLALLHSLPSTGSSTDFCVLSSPRFLSVVFWVSCEIRELSAFSWCPSRKRHPFAQWMLVVELQGSQFCACSFLPFKY